MSILLRIVLGIIIVFCTLKCAMGYCVLFDDINDHFHIAYKNELKSVIRLAKIDYLQSLSLLVKSYPAFAAIHINGVLNRSASENSCTLMLIPMQITVVTCLIFSYSIFTLILESDCRIRIYLILPHCPVASCVIQ